MKRFLTVLIAILVATSGVFTFNTSASAASGTKKTVQVVEKTTYINAKADPKTKRLKQAKKGEKYEHLGWTTGKGYAKGAYKVKVGNKTGYISAKATKLVNPPKKSAPKKVAPKKTTAEKPVSNSSKIKVSKASGTYIVTATSLNVRSGNNTKYKSIGQLKKNKQVTITGKTSNNWYQIKHNGKIGYVSGSYLKVKTTSKPASKKPAPKPKAPAKNPSNSNKFKVNTKDMVKLNVKAISQRPELPTGCEIVAFTMMVNHQGGKGAKVTKTQMANEMPRSSDPNKGFIGNPYNSSGVAIYPPGLKKMTTKYTGSYKNMTGSSLKQFRTQLKSGKAIVMWGKFVYWNINMSHAVTLTGYDSKGFYFVDPQDGKNKYLTDSQLAYHYNQLGKRALSY